MDDAHQVPFPSFSVAAQDQWDELSKHLGGDEAHTHLVKGLDVALARSVKSQMAQKEQDERSDDDDDDDKSNAADDNPILTTKQEALDYLQNPTQTYPTLQYY